MTPSEKPKAYKAFNNDWTCKGFKYEVGKTYEMDEEPIVCEKGFHACIDIDDCLHYYPLSDNPRFAEVEILGLVDFEVCTTDSKICTNKIKIVREIPLQEVFNLIKDENNNYGCCNEGHSNIGIGNTGNSNIGNNNVGKDNKGSYNKGNYNIGHHNMGNSNKGNNNYGCFNVGNNQYGIFNKEINQLKTCEKNGIFYAFNKEIDNSIFVILKNKIECFDVSDIDFIQKNNDFIEYAKSLKYFDNEIFEEITGHKV